jgi:ribulose-phosphate 3-epimerase
MIEIIPTVVPASADDVAQVAMRYRDFAPVIHIDVADGIFAPNVTWMPREGEMLPSIEGVAYEAHLMVSDAQKIGIAFARAGAFRIIGHIEAMRDLVSETFMDWKNNGARECVIGTLYDTPVESLEPFIPLCDALMFMGITAIGVQGLPADVNAPAHAAALRSRYPGTLIEVDGAVSEKNIVELARGGVRRFCAGSAISKSLDPAAMHRHMIELAEAAL